MRRKQNDPIAGRNRAAKLVDAFRFPNQLNHSRHRPNPRAPHLKQGAQRMAQTVPRKIANACLVKLRKTNPQIAQSGPPRTIRQTHQQRAQRSRQTVQQPQGQVRSKHQENSKKQNFDDRNCPFSNRSRNIEAIAQRESNDLSRRRVATGLEGVPDMDVGAEAYRDVFTASAKLRASRRRRVEANNL